MSFESTPYGAHVGIEEHKARLKELLSEESDLVKSLSDETFDENDQRRLNDIHKEMEYREEQIKRLS